MSFNEYNQLLKFLYFEGYAESYAEAEDLLESMSDDEFDEIFEAFKEPDLDKMRRQEDRHRTAVEYLFVEGFADTIEKAEVMAENISETWVNEIMEARASERRGLGSPERRLPSGQLVGSRGERIRKGKMGGRHYWSGGEGGSRTERGVKKNEPGSQHSRLNPPEEGGRQLKRGSKAAMQRWHSARD